MNHETVFGDLRSRAKAVYRIHTQGSVYVVGMHETNGRRFVIVRGEPGTDREHVVVRDSEPRIGDRSLFDVPPAEWVGKELEVATMTSSTIVTVADERDPVLIAAVGADGKLEKNPWARPEPDPPNLEFTAPRPPGMPASPRIVPAQAKGTHPVVAAGALAKQVVVGQVPTPAPARPAAEPEYPERHVLYAENIAALLRSIARRERVFEDVSPLQLVRLRKALDDAAVLLEQVRRRDRK